MPKHLMAFETDPPHGPHEADFRRGFHHGAVAMLEAIRDGVPIDKLEDYIEEELSPWRESAAEPAFPPYPKVSANLVDDHRLSELVSELNRGAAIMMQTDSDKEKLKGAVIITRTGQRLVDAGGMELVRRAYRRVAAEAQRQVEVQFCNLTDDQGNRWLP